MDTGAMSPLMIGAGLFVLGVVMFTQEHKKKKRCNKRVNAVCCDVIAETNVTKGIGSVRGVKQYVPVYEIEMEEGPVQVKGQIGRPYADDYTKGTRVVLCCNPDNYRDFYVPDEDFYKNGRIALLFTTGIACMALGIFLFFIS